MAGIFKAYDVRGTYPDQLDETTAYGIGRAFPNLLTDEDFTNGRTVVVGHDMRSHSKPLTAELIRGLCEAGLDVVDIGLATTPMGYFAVGHLKASGGIQVTASHNPAAYNGFKLSRHGARPVSGDHGLPLLEAHVKAGDTPAAATPGRVEQHDIRSAYAAHLKSFLRRPSDARKLKVVVDAANGMGVLYRELLEAAGIELVPLYFELDGTFPNHEANPLKLSNLDDLRAEVLRVGADLGVAFDGDADRAAFVDERGEPVGSDLSTALIGGEILLREPGQAIVFDLRSSRAVAEHIEACGGKPIRERVGHSFIKATLRENDGVFGGELAGHYYFRDHYTADCSLLAVYEMLNLLWKSGSSMSELVAPLLRYAKSPEINFEVVDKAGKIEQLAKTYQNGEIDYLDGITVQYPSWWFNVRPSNTENYLRLVAEATNAEQLEAKLAELMEILGKPAD